MAGGTHAARADRGRRRLVAAGAAAALLVPAIALALVRAPDASAAATPTLPFDLVASTSSKLVLAHYVPWFPVSFDNAPASRDTYETAYLDPDGEGGKHAAYGGFLRDRPLGRGVSADPAWRDADMRQEVREAISAGLDGFAVDIPSVSPTSRSWAAVVRLLRAAHDVDPSFHVLLQPDMVGLARFDSATIATALSQLATYPAAMRFGDGRLLVSPFYAEKRTVSWWTDWLGTMSVDHGVDVAFFPVLLNDVVWGDDFAGISVGMGNWGSRNPAWNSPTATGATSPRGRIAAVHARGDLWMQPVSVQDERPRGGLFDEAANTENLRDTWQVARDGGADWVLLPTWNDYAEGTAIAPSVKHGRALLDLMAYYAAWFKTGRAPQIVRDAVYLTHRTQPSAALPEYGQTRLMALRGGTPARDTVEALAFLTAPASVTVTVGGAATTCALPAGVATCVAPLRAGTVSAAVTRSGSTAVTVASPYQVTSSPYVQDLQYVAVSSLRTGTAVLPASAAPQATQAPAPSVTAPASPGAAPPTATSPTVASPGPSGSSSQGASTRPTSSAPVPQTPPATIAASTLLRLAWSAGTTPGSVRFTATVWPAASGLVIVWVDGGEVARAWTDVAGRAALPAVVLPAGHHDVHATFSPSDTRAYRFSSSPSLSLTTP